MDKNIYGDDGLIIDDKHIPEETEAEAIKFRKPNRFRRKKTTKLVLLILCICLLAAGVVFGVYKLFFDKNEPYDDSLSYYFSSNHLTEQGTDIYQTGEISFNVCNFADDLRISKEKIESFDIKVSANGEDITKKVNISTGERAMESGVRSTCEVTIELTDEYYGIPVEVNCVSYPREVTLKGTFTVKPVHTYTVSEASDSEYKLLDTSVAVEVTLKAEEDTSFSLEYDSDRLIIDSTNEFITAYSTGDNSYLLPVAGGSELTVIFYKKDVDEVFDRSTDALKIEKSDKFIEPVDMLAQDENEAEEGEE